LPFWVALAIFSPDHKSRLGAKPMANSTPTATSASTPTPMTHLQTYKLEEMKQLRGLIAVFIQEIAKLEIFTITAIAGAMYFNLHYDGSSSYVEWAIRIGPFALTTFLLLKALRFAMRIKLIDDYLLCLEKEFLGDKKGWIAYFRKKTWLVSLIPVERIAITLVFFVISIVLMFVSPSEFRAAKNPSSAITPIIELNPDRTDIK
jgi:hypothetical protein